MIRVHKFFKDLRNDIKKNQNLKLSLGYWVLCALLLVISPYIISILGFPIGVGKKTLDLILNWDSLKPLLLLCVGFCILYKKYSSPRSYIRNSVWTFVILFVTLYFVRLYIDPNDVSFNGYYSWLYSTTPVKAISFLIIFCRAPFLLLLVTIFILLFNFIIYSEEKEELNKCPKIKHKKYLQYLQTFSWILAFGFLASVPIFTTLADKLKGSISGPPEYPRIIWLVQLFIIFLFGISLVIYAFHIKLKEIEDLIKHD